MDKQKQTPESYVVTDIMRSIWQIEMDAASVLLDLCQKHDIKIWASYGTLLGVVRHHGFIPWDDDIDFLVMRKDFDKLYHLAKQKDLLPWPYKLVIVDSAIIRICNSNTTMLNPHSKLDFKHNFGIWVDILCLDKAPDTMSNNVLRTYNSLRRRAKMINNAKNYCFNSFKGFRWFASHMFCLLFFMFQDISVAIDRLMKDERISADKYGGNRLWNFSQQAKERPTKEIKTYDVSWFSETVMLPFGEMFFPCPQGFEHCLVTEFGENWRTPIMGTSGHEGAIIDVNTPYKEYISKRLSDMRLRERLGWML